MNQNKSGHILIKKKKIPFPDEFINEMGVVESMRDFEREYQNKKDNELGKDFPVCCSEQSIRRLFEVWKVSRDPKADFETYFTGKPYYETVDVISTASYLQMDRLREKLNKTVALMWKSPKHKNRRKFAQLFMKPRNPIGKKNKK